MNKYLKKTIEYAAGNLFNKILLVILLPIFTHYLVPAEYAVYTNLMIFFALASMIVLIGLRQALFSHFYEVKTEAYRFSLISSVYLILTVTGIIFSILMIVFRSELSSLLLRDQSYSHLFIPLAIILFFNTIFSISTGFLNIMEKSRSYAIISTLHNLIALILIIIFVWQNKFSLELYFTFLASGTFVAALISFYKIIRVMHNYKLENADKKYFSIAIITSMMRFGIVMIPGTIAMLILQSSDRYMLTYLSPNTLHDVGIYSAGYRIGMIMHFLVSLVSLVYLPAAMKRSKSKRAKEINRNMFKYYLIFGSIFGALIISYSQEIFHFIIDVEYVMAYQIVFAGVISAFLYGVFHIVNVYYYAHQKAGIITLAVVVGSLLNIGLNFVLIPKYGFFGAGIASVFAYFVILMINYFIAVWTYKLKYPLWLLFAGLALLALASVINFLVAFSLTVLFIKTTFYLILLLVLYQTLKNNKELHKIMSLIRERKSEKAIQSPK
jgi:O-antigen/teichoic acid export membrane protein